MGDDVVGVVKVKPLVWVKSQSDVWIAKTNVGEYFVGFDDGWWCELHGPDYWDWEAPEDRRSYCGPSAAKAAAQADYEARIMAALDVQPITVQDAARVPEVQSLIEALRSTLNFVENTENEMGIILGSGDRARAALRAITDAD